MDQVDLSDWQKLREEIEARPEEPGRWKVVFRGDPHEFDETWVCPDCHQTVRSWGISFGPHLPEEDLDAHRSTDCPAWRNRLWRLWFRILDAPYVWYEHLRWRRGNRT